MQIVNVQSVSEMQDSVSGIHFSYVSALNTDVFKTYLPEIPDFLFLTVSHLSVHHAPSPSLHYPT